MNHDVGGNRNLFSKEVGKVNGEKWSHSRIKDGNGSLAVGEDEM